jgi:hypothetical protein
VDDRLEPPLDLKIRGRRRTALDRVMLLGTVSNVTWRARKKQDDYGESTSQS